MPAPQHGILKLTCEWVPETDPMKQGLFEYAADAYGYLASTLKRGEQTPAKINPEMFGDKTSFDDIQDYCMDMIVDRRENHRHVLHKSSINADMPDVGPEVWAYAVIMQMLHVRANTPRVISAKKWLALRYVREGMAEPEVKEERVAKVRFSNRVAGLAFMPWICDAIRRDAYA